MSLAFTDLPAAHPGETDRDVLPLLAPRHYQEAAIAAYEDAELLLTAILPDARVEHVGASAIAGAYSTGGVDICVAVPPEAFDESLGVLVEAGYVPRSRRDAPDRLGVLDAPHAAVPLALRLIETGSRHESLIRFRNALRADPTLLARYNALKIAASPLGGATYREAKMRFIRDVLGA